MGYTDWGGKGGVLMGGTMLSKSLIQFSVVGWVCVSSLLFGLRPNYGGGNEDTGDLLQEVPCMHCCTCAPTLQQAAAHPGLCQRLLDTHRPGSVSCVVPPPFSWVLVCTRFCLCLPMSISPVPHKFWWLYGEVNGDLQLLDVCIYILKS